MYYMKSVEKCYIEFIDKFLNNHIFLIGLMKVVIVLLPGILMMNLSYFVSHLFAG